jgi:hypothetical protein
MVVQVIAKAALVLSVVAVVLSVFTLATRGGSSSGTCGPASATEVGCTGNGAPPSKYGACTPEGRQSGVMFWSCKKP